MDIEEHPPRMRAIAKSIAATLLPFTTGLSNRLIDMKDAQTTVKNRLVYHPSPLTLAYNNISKSGDRIPPDFNQEKFESGLAGWSDYTHFIKAKNDQDYSPQPLHIFMTPAYLPFDGRQMAEDLSQDFAQDFDRHKHPRRYDRQPGAKNEWLWTKNVAQICRQSSC